MGVCQLRQTAGRGDSGAVQQSNSSGEKAVFQLVCM